MEIYDLIIVGGGPAAVSAGIYAGRKKLKTVLICKDWGGQMALTSSIENYPGIETISGIELTEKMKEQLERYQNVIPDLIGNPDSLILDSRVNPQSSLPSRNRGLEDRSENDTFISLVSFPRRRESRPLILDSRVNPRFLGVMPENNTTTIDKNGTLTIKENTEVVAVKKGEIIKVKTDSGDYRGRTLIIANGRIPKRLNIPGEDKFKGRGLSYCVHCDAPFFKDKAVAIIGGGNAGLEAALDLTNYAKKIYILEFSPQLTADEVLREKIKEFPRIVVLTEAAAKEIKGDNFVRTLVYEDKKSGRNKELAVQGVFSEIGWLANSNFIRDVVKLNTEGEIVIDKNNRTSRPNIFAAGDITDVPEKQIIIAAGEGVKAALAAYRYLKKH